MPICNSVQAAEEGEQENRPTKPTVRMHVCIAAFLWARKVVFTSFLVGISISRKSEVVITSGKLGKADSIPSFRVEKHGGCV